MHAVQRTKFVVVDGFVELRPCSALNWPWQVFSTIPDEFLFPLFAPVLKGVSTSMVGEDGYVARGCAANCGFFILSPLVRCGFGHITEFLWSLLTS